MSAEQIKKEKARYKKRSELKTRIHNQIVVSKRENGSNVSIKHE